MMARCRSKACTFPSMSWRPLWNVMPSRLHSCSATARTSPIISPEKPGTILKTSATSFCGSSTTGSAAKINPPRCLGDSLSIIISGERCMASRSSSVFPFTKTSLAAPPIVVEHNGFSNRFRVKRPPGSVRSFSTTRPTVQDASVPNSPRASPSGRSCIRYTFFAPRIATADTAATSSPPAGWPRATPCASRKRPNLSSHLLTLLTRTRAKNTSRRSTVCRSPRCRCSTRLARWAGLSPSTEESRSMRASE
mmetsp:Transcript_56926/g.130953  ORF Transcript_56926/g.130953 Transcript_56926/m.130953 type:complete len:251 (+) Transcript_56926:646-1398(+)